MPILRLTAALCALSALGCAAGWPPPPGRSEPGVRAGFFSVPETAPYAVRGRYSGELIRRGDSLWIVVDSGAVAHRRPPGEQPVVLEYIAAGLVGPRGFGEDPFIRGSERMVRANLRPGDEVPLGPFFVGVTFDGLPPLDELSVRIIHRMSAPGMPILETYTFFSESIGDILEPTLAGPNQPE